MEKCAVGNDTGGRRSFRLVQPTLPTIHL